MGDGIKVDLDQLSQDASSTHAVADQVGSKVRDPLGSVMDMIFAAAGDDETGANIKKGLFNSGDVGSTLDGALITPLDDAGDALQSFVSQARYVEEVQAQIFDNLR